MEARVLHVVVVLVRPEPMHISVGLALAEHAASSCPPLVDRVLPVLATDQAPKEGARVIGHIPGGVDALHVGLAVLVHHDAVLDLHIRARQDVGNALDSDADDDEITVEPSTAARHYTLHVTLAFKRCHRLLTEHLYPF